MKPGKVLSTGALLCLLSARLLAQQGEVELDPVTITATLHPVSSSSTGRNLTVVKGDQFSRLPVHSIDELLRYLPGLEVQMRGPMGTQSDFVLRGGTFQQVLVVLDGIRINDPNTGHFNSYIPIAPAEIDRIEILKGASSAIYGSEAVGGVINIITKTFAAKRDQQKKQLGVQSSVGEYGLYSANLGGFYQSGKTALGGGLLSNNATGQQQRGTKGYFHNTSASLSVNHFLNENWNLAFRSAYDRRDFSAQNFYTSFISDTAKERVSSFWNQVKLGYVKNQQSFSLDVAYKSLQDQYQFNTTGSANQNKSSLLQALAIYKWEVAKKTTVTTGGQWVDKQMSSNDRGDHSLSQMGTFLIVDQKVGSSVTVSPAMRVEWHERNKWQLVPQINVSYKLLAWQLRGSAGRTLRDADFTERYNNYNKAFVASGSIGNPNLVAENSFSYEAGADFFGIKKLKVSATFFEQRFTHLIDYVTTPYAAMPRKDNLSPTGVYALAKNIGKVKTTGFETDIQYNNSFQNKHQLWATLGFTWIDSQSEDTSPSLYLSSHAKYLTNFTFRYGLSSFFISLTGVYKHRLPQISQAVNASINRDYFILNARAEAFLVANKCSIFFQADNILNKQYSDLLGSIMPERWLMGGFKVTL